MERHIRLPNRTGSGDVETLTLIDHLVIVGANGSGKSRLGLWIEQQNGYRPVKKVSAQRLLSFQPFAPALNLEQSLNELLNNSRHLDVTSQQNDFNQLLSAIFAEKAKRDSDYVEGTRKDKSELKLKIPDSAIDKLIRIWQDVLPHLQLTEADRKITAVKPSGASYEARLMSDGERVSLYLIGQCMIVPKNSVVIIDEPELHLHKALMARLWNEIEAERPDCIFVYITHDLDFAASRVKSDKIWVKSFDGRQWIWELVPNSDNIPENLLLEIIGSRKPILFVEGERGSNDHAIYQYVYSEFAIIPRGTSAKVIESLRGIRGNPSLHAIEAFGLVDRDYKTEEEIKAISKEGLFVLNFAEVENLLLIPELIKAIAKNQANNEETEFQKVKQFVLEELKRDFDRVVSYRTSLIINFQLNAFDTKKIGEANINAAISDLISKIDVTKIFKENHDLYKKILEDGNYEDALKFYNNKGLLARVSTLLGLGNGQYTQLILRLLNIDERKEEIIIALKKYLPQIK